MAETFKSQITVDKNIVSLLSKFTYERSFPFALREVVSNAYDADATTARIDIEREQGKIVIHDNGNGMTRKEFEFYLRIAGQQRGKRETPKFGRKRIGQFGVGFLAILPFCESLQITSTAENSDEVFTAEIPATRFFRSDGKNIDVGEVEVIGEISKNPKLKAEHFTRISLVKLTDLAKRYFSQKPLTEKKDRVNSWPAMRRLKWEMQEDLPLALPAGSKLDDVLSYSEPVGMSVYLGEDKLFRNESEGEIIDSGKLTVDGISFSYAIITPWKGVRPFELRGLKMRLNNVGVGPREIFGIEMGRRYSRLQWLSGEVQILSGLDSAVTLSRDSFISTPEYEAMYAKLAAILRKWADYVETVDVAARDMTKHLSGGKQVSVAPKKEIVERNIQRLVDRGFTVQRVDKRGESGTQPVRVDRSKREIVVYEEHPGLDDTIVLGGRTRRIFYLRPKAGPASFDRACRMNKHGDFEIDASYPLFRSKRYGDIFKKIYIISAFARHECSSREEMYSFILEQIDKEFRNF